MPYVLDFSIVSFIYLMIITAFYIGQRKVKSTSNYLYFALLILGLLSLVFDVLSGYTAGDSSVNIVLEYAINFIFLLIAQLNGPVFLGYVLVLTGDSKHLKRRDKWILLIPFMIVFVALIMSFFSKFGIFYFDNQNVYKSGSTHFLLYVAVITYLILSFFAIILKRKTINVKKTIGIVSFLFLSCIAMLIQVFFPYILVNSMGNALALAIMYFLLQGPDNRIDPLTKLLTSNSLKFILKELDEQKQDYTIYMYMLDSFYTINQMYGVKIGDLTIVEFTKYLEKKYPGNYIIRHIGDVFVVIDILKDYNPTLDYLASLQRDIPKIFKVDTQQIRVLLNLYGIKRKSVHDYEEMLVLINFITKEHELGNDKPLLLVDDKYKESCKMHYTIERILDNAITNKSIEVYYQPIHSNTGELIALESLCRLFDEKLGFISPDVFIKIAEGNGSIFRLGEIIIEKVCDFVERNNVSSWNLHHIGINLSFLQCTRSDLYESITSIIKNYSVPHSLLAFEITETATSSAMHIVKQNMEKLIADDFKFLLDDFGNGYANYNYILELPFFCIKFDRMVLWEAMKNPQAMSYFKALVNSLKKIDLITVSEGVETIEQAKILQKINVDMLQGYLFNKALREDKLLEYVVSYKKIL